MRVVGARHTTRYTGRDQHGGFTLLELIVAAAILAFGTVAVLQAITHGLANSRMSYANTCAIQLAESKMAELRSAGTLENGVAEGSFSDLPAGQGFSDSFRWRTEVQAGQDEGTVSVSVTVFWGTGTVVRRVTLESVLPNKPQAGNTPSGG